MAMDLKSTDILPPRVTVRDRAGHVCRFQKVEEDVTVDVVPVLVAYGCFVLVVRRL